jgi:sugar fermentation stimulation protein A
VKFNPTLQQARLVKRYKRFLADVIDQHGKLLTIHCPNTGSMKNCWQEGATVWFSTSDNSKRKYAHTWEIVETPAGHKAGINTSRANALVLEAINTGVISELRHFTEIRQEVPYGEESSRIDLLLTNSSGQCFVEVKNVTLYMNDGVGMFPDAVSSRGAKHLRELIAAVRQGHRAVLFFCVQHTGIKRVCAARAIDPAYADLLRLAINSGVEIIAYGGEISEQAIQLTKRIEFFDESIGL